VKLRDERAAAAARVFGEAARADAAAGARLQAARDQQAALGRAQAAVARGERAELEAGALRAADLQQGGLWAIEAQAARARAEAVAAEAQRSRAQAAAAASQARDEAARRRADADAAELLLTRERAAAAAREQASLEEAAEEAFVSRWKHASPHRPMSPGTTLATGLAGAPPSRGAARDQRQGER
jgi:hypothetical protein